MWTWIRKNIFRVNRGGKHRAAGLSTLEKFAVRAQPGAEIPESSYQAPIDRAAVLAAMRAPVAILPVIPGYPQPLTEVERAKNISGLRTDYVASQSVLDETRTSTEDWTA